jgi:WD40 repeat protein
MQSSIRSVSFCPHNRHLLVTTASDGRLRVWDVRMALRPLHDCSVCPDGLFDSFWIPGRNLIVVASAQGIRVCEISELMTTTSFRMETHIPSTQVPCLSMACTFVDNHDSIPHLLVTAVYASGLAVHYDWSMDKDHVTAQPAAAAHGSAQLLSRTEAIDTAAQMDLSQAR